jgi:L-methionine (R)-S-oxide reductase
VKPLSTHHYEPLMAQYAELVAETRDAIANAANLSALLHHGVAGLNWAGFYFLRGDKLVLGPFQGKPACVEIALGRGVCGTAAARREAVIVPNVHEFPGHIFCDTSSNSEIVVPLLDGDRLLGVLDVDSPKFNRFNTDDQQGLEQLAAMWVAGSDLGAL